MSDPIETLAKRVLDECVEVLVDGCGAVTGVLTPVDIATALLRAAIEAERAAAVAPFRELAGKLDLAIGHAPDVGVPSEIEAARYGTLADVADELHVLLTSAPSADELVRRVREEAVAPFRELAKSYELASQQNLAEAKRYSELGRFDLFNSHMMVGSHCGAFATELERLLPPAKDEADG